MGIVGGKMQYSWIIYLVLGVCLAFIPSCLAAKKGYSQKGFYLYGLFFFIPSLIHVLFLPDLTNPSEKLYKRKALLDMIAVICLLSFQMLVLGAVEIFNGYSRFYMNKHYLSALICMFLIISVMIGRNYKFSMIIFAVELAQVIFSILKGVMYVRYSSLLQFDVGLLVSDAFRGIAFAILIYVLYRGGLKRDTRINKFLFLLPSIAMLVFCSCSLWVRMLYSYVKYPPLELVLIVVTFFAYLFLGLFYKEELLGNQEEKVFESIETRIIR